MPTNTALLVRRAHALHGTPLLRHATLSSAALAVGLLLAACNRAAPSEPANSAQKSTVASGTPGTSMVQAGDDCDVLRATKADEAAVAAVAAAWDAAWNAGDSNGIAALFTDDAEFVNGRGQVAVGVAAIGAQNAANLAGPFRGSHIQGTIRHITFLSGTSAVLDVDSRLTGFVSLPPGTVEYAPGEQRGRHKRVLVKRGGTWRIQQMQITTIAPGVT